MTAGILHKLFDRFLYRETISGVVTHVIPETEKSWDRKSSSKPCELKPCELIRQKYRIHVQYVKDGDTYLAVSDRTYSHGILFPGVQLHSNGTACPTDLKKSYRAIIPGTQVVLRVHKHDMSKVSVAGVKTS